MKKHFYLSVFLCLLSLSVFAESLTPGFYNSANGLKDGALKDALKSLIRDHTAIPYGSGASSTWGVFFYSDRNDEGYMMDMYCDDWSYVSNPGDVASGCNIEHSFAKSWWGGDKNDAYKDCYHLNPSNSTANSARSNYPLGVPETDIKTSGSLKVGKIHHPTLNVDFSVFEPKDEYKGDFARAYFYMATCYGHWSNGEIDDVLSHYNGWRVDNAQVGSKYAMQNDNYLEFQPWEQEILIQWHRQDPVSEKEIKRMDAVSNFQHNRNPFIDYPYLAEFIWGEKAGEALDMSKLVASSDATFVPGVSNGWNGEGGSTVDPEDPPTVDPVDPEDGTITVAQALEIGAALASGAKTTEEYVIEGYVSNISSFYNPDYGNETLWITDNPYSTAASKNDGAFEIYRGVPNTNAEVGYGAKVRITCKIKNYNNTIIENDGTNIPFEVLEPSTFVPETPTVAEAAATGQYMDAGVKQLYYSVFKGYIQSVTTAYKNGVATFKMADTKDAAEGDLVAFKTTILKADTLKLVPGAHVQVTGYLMNYGGTAEIAQGAIAAFVPEPGEIVDPVDPPTVDPVDPEDGTITVAQALEIGAALASGAKTTEEYVIEGYVSNISSFYNPDYGNETLWITDNPYSTAASKNDGAFEIYRGVPNTNAEVGYGAKVRITCKIKNYNNTIIENDGTNIPFEVLEPSTFVPETPTVAEAAATGQYMDAGVKQLYYSVFKGYIQSVTTAYKNGVATFKMADTKDAAEGDLVAFKTTILKADTLKLVPGAHVQVTGYLMNYGGTAEIAQGAIAAFVPEPLVLEEVNCNVRYLDKNAAELSSEVLTFHVPEAPAIDGFTFLRWEFVAGDMANGLTIQAVYKPNDDMTDLPSEIQVPGNKAMKLVRDGNVYILKGDQVFTIHGQRVQ